MLVVVGVFVWLGGHLDQRGAGQPQRLFLLFALRLGDDDDGAVAARRGDQSQADAGIARRGFDDEAAGPEIAALFRGKDHLARRPVLDRLAGIHEFGLAVDGAAGAFGRLAQVDQRRIADDIDNGGFQGHGILMGWRRWPANYSPDGAASRTTALAAAGRRKHSSRCAGGGAKIIHRRDHLTRRVSWRFPVV